MVPEVGLGLDADLGEARAAIGVALTRARAGERQVVLVGPGPVSADYGAGTRGSFAGFGADVAVALGEPDGGDPTLPAALAVGAYFAPRARRGFAVAPDAASIPRVPDEPVTLVVLGDGSACRTEKAPGYLDPRAAGYDNDVRDALASGDGARLAALDAGLGAALLAAGAPVWRAVAPLLTRRYQADVLYDGAPFGVGYVVAVWT